MLYETVMGWMAQSEKRGIAIGEKRGIAIGEKQGIAIGEKRGSYEKAVQTARRAVECGIPVETVAKFTELPVEEVQSLI